MSTLNNNATEVVDVHLGDGRIGSTMLAGEVGGGSYLKIPNQPTVSAAATSRYRLSARVVLEQLNHPQQCRFYIYISIVNKPTCTFPETLLLCLNI